MKIALLGRTGHLLKTGRLLHDLGHSIKLIGTARPEEYYDAGPKDFEKYANAVGATFFEDQDINTTKRIQQIKDSEAEIGISINWPRLLGEEICAALPFGILNGHAGDLPRYRGNACANWAILNGENKMGLCVHIMDPNRLDTGPVLTRDYLPLTENTYIENIYSWYDLKFPELFSKAINGLADGTIIPNRQPSDPNLSHRCYPRRAEDGQIDWKDSSENIHRLIRASSRPLPGAYTNLEGTGRLTIWRAEKFDHPGDFCAIPGQILYRHEGDPIISCGIGTLRLTQVSLAGIDDSLAKKEVGRHLRLRLINY